MDTTASGHTSNNLDQMRLVFAAMVLLSHAAELVYGNRSHEPLTQIFHTISFGELGVDCFFILSGFMIARSWEMDPGWLRYLRKRVLRIYPGFIVAFLLSVVLVGTIGAQDAQRYIADARPARLAWDMATLNTPSTPPTFLGSHYDIVNGSLWTIRYEFLCYLLVMIIGLLGVLSSARATVALWVVLASAFVVFRAPDASGTSGAVMGSHAEMMLRLTPIYLSGVTMYKNGLWKVRSRALIVAAVGLLVAGMSFPVTAELAVMTVGAYLLFIIGFTPIRHARMRRLPDVSYGVYLYGWPVQKLLIFWWPALPFQLVFLASLILCLALGYASWMAVERPMLALKSAGWGMRRPRPL